MKETEQERQNIVDYLADAAPDETVEHLEKVHSERVLGQTHNIWDVHTNIERWWVITGPTNLYSQIQFPSMDIALTFHVGLMTRVRNLQELKAPPEQAELFPKAWRKWEQAASSHNQADEAEEFQAIGMMCRESLIAFVKEASQEIVVPSEIVKPKASNFLGWMEVVANTVEGGESAERRRGYIKATAKSTWELVQWLTHASSATRFDGYFALKATQHVLTVFTLIITRFRTGAPNRCPECASYKVAVN